MAAKIFILEDDPARIAAFQQALIGCDVTVKVWVHGNDGAIKAFKPPYDLILLDHDLGGQTYVNSEEEETGFTFAKWLGAAPTMYHPLVIVHSYNPDGAKAMIRLLHENGWDVAQEPFGVALLQWLQWFSKKG